MPSGVKVYVAYRRESDYFRRGHLSNSAASQAGDLGMAIDIDTIRAAQGCKVKIIAVRVSKLGKKSKLAPACYTDMLFAPIELFEDDRYYERHNFTIANKNRTSQKAQRLLLMRYWQKRDGVLKIR